MGGLTMCRFTIGLGGLVALVLATTADAVNICGRVEPMDFSGTPVLPFGGEYLGLGPTGTTIVNTEVDVVFTTTGIFDAADIAVGLMFVHVNGGVATGFTGAQLDWSGQGTFTAKFQTDALNGLIVTDQPHSGFLLTMGNLNPGAGPAQGEFESLVFKITFAPCPPGDATMDADVNIDDLLAVVNAWGACPSRPAECPADFDHNNTVNVDDLLLVINHWGPWCGNCK
jgi:hypothetical protein